MLPSTVRSYGSDIEVFAGALDLVDPGKIWLPEQQLMSPVSASHKLGNVLVSTSIKGGHMLP